MLAAQGHTCPFRRATLCCSLPPRPQLRQHQAEGRQQQLPGAGRRKTPAGRRQAVRVAAAGAKAQHKPTLTFEEQFGTDYGVLSEKVQELAAEVVERLGGTSLYLVGMMGSGKSTVGRLLETALRYPFFDTDTLIEQLTKSTVSEIFAEEGEEGFREVETQVLHELKPFKSVVVSTGGGAVLRRENWGHMQHGVVIWLEGPPELLAARALKDGTATRPLLARKPGQEEQADEYAATVEKLQKLLEQRKQHYAQADVRVSLAGIAGDAAEATGAPAALVTYRLLHNLNERLKKDEIERRDLAKFSIKDTSKLPASMRVLPKKEGAATAAEE